MNVPYTVSVDVKTSGSTESIPVTTTSNVDASLQSAPFSAANPASRGVSDAGVNERSTIAAGRHASDFRSSVRSDNDVVVTTVTY